jgi:DNA-binding beta-propeller fold protein YncE
MSADGRALYVAAPTEGSISTLTPPLVEPTSTAGSTSTTGSTSSTGSTSTSSSTSTSKSTSSETTPATGSTTGGSTASVLEPTLASIFGNPAMQAVVNPCTAVNGYDGACAVGIATQGLDSLTLSPDGKQLYATAPGSSAVDVFAPGLAGALTETSCLMVDSPPGLCGASTLMSAPTGLAISPDGRDVYAADSDDGGKIDMFSRDPSSGALTVLGCIDNLPPPEKHEEGNGEEEGEEGHEPTPADPCTSVPGLPSVEEIAVSADGSAVYAIGAESAVVFSRDPSTGKLTEVSCADGEDSHCTSFPTLDGVDGAALSPDGREVYVTAKGSDAVMAFGLGAAVTTSQASATSAGMARVAVACPRGLRRSCTGRLSLLRSLSGKRVHGRHGRRAVRRIAAGDSGAFSIRPGADATIAVHIASSSRQLLLTHRSVRLMAVVVANPSAGGSGFGRPVTFKLER